jgi:glycerol-3-phosphate O-acyltransferase / dihydroxyacetone phosphate acyltransferase
LSPTSPSLDPGLKGSTPTLATVSTLAAPTALERPRRRRGIRDRLFGGVARLVSRFFFRSFEVVGAEPDGGPVILAASHLNGLVDPVLLVAATGRLPRFLAKATLWRVLPARPFLWLVRLIPVRRPEDYHGDVSNEATFDKAVDALAAGHEVAVFPEGTTHDRPHLVPLRTGTARIALQALDSGVQDVRIVPVGLDYEDKVDLRGRALASFGEPIDVTDEVAARREAGDDDRAVVRALTDRVEERLRTVTPDFRSIEEALALTGAAEVALRGNAPRERVELAQAFAVARELADLGDGHRSGVVHAQARYQLLLNGLGLKDEDVTSRVSATYLARRLVGLAVLVVVLAPFALAGMLVNLVPVAIVLVVGMIPHAPVTKGTVRILVALVVFPLTWVLVAWFDVGAGWISDIAGALTFPLTAFLDRSGTAPSIVVFLAAPLLGLAALAIVERSQALWATWRSWRILVDRRGQLDEVRAVRGAVVEAVRVAQAEQAAQSR